MGLVSMREMLNKASREGYAVGQFNTNNLEWTLAILDQCQEMNSPVILGVSMGAAKYMGGYNTVVMTVKGLIMDKGYTIPIAIHLDHGDSFDICKKALDAGFTSVMIDGSHLTLDENIALTKRVVDYAKKTGASVEAELGHVGGQEEHVVADILYAIPAECKKMVVESGIDCLAPALGSVHGPYIGEPKLGFKEMKEIFDLVKIPLVLHGGSGIPEEQIRRAISLGTAKINVNTEFQQEWTAITRKVLAENQKVYDPRKVIGPGKEGIKKVAKEKILLFGSQNKA